MKNVINRNKIGRNDLCPCGSGKKHKKCCLVEGQNISSDEQIIEQMIAEVEAKTGGKVIDIFFDENLGTLTITCIEEK